MKKGIYRDNKVYYYEPKVHALTGGNWGSGWSGTKSFGGLKVYDFGNRMEWWPQPNQQVHFELIEGKAHIRKLGEVMDIEYCERYCNDSII